MDPSHNTGSFADKTQILKAIIYDSSPHFLAGQYQYLSQGFSWLYRFLADPLFYTDTFFFHVCPPIQSPLPSGRIALKLEKLKLLTELVSSKAWKKPEKVSM